MYHYVCIIRKQYKINLGSSPEKDNIHGIQRRKQKSTRFGKLSTYYLFFVLFLVDSFFVYQNQNVINYLYTKLTCLIYIHYICVIFSSTYKLFLKTPIFFLCTQKYALLPIYTL